MNAEQLFDEMIAAQKKGDLPLQLDLLHDLLSVVRRTGTREAEIDVLLRIGNACQESGRPQEAHASRMTAFALTGELGERCPLKLRMLVEGDVGRSFIQFRDWPNAESHTREALRLAEELSAKRESLVSRVNLGMVLSSTHREAKAAELAEEVLREAAERNDHYVLALQHLNLAQLRMHHQYRVMDALRHVRQALTHADLSGDRAVRRHAQLFLGDVHTALSHIHRTADDADQAAQFLEESLQLACASGDLQLVSEVEMQFARLMEDHGRAAEAAAHFQNALEALERVRETLGYDEFQLTYFQWWQPLYDAATSFLLRQGRPAEAFLASERLRSRLLLSALGKRNVTTADSPELHDILRDYENALQANDNEAVAAARARFLELYDEQSRYHTEPDAERSAAPATIEQVQSVLQPDEALLAYHVTKESLIVFTADRESFHFQHLPYARERLARDVEEINQILRDPEQEEPRPALERLFAILIAPLLAHVDAKPHWTIVPHGPLHGLPGAALHGRGKYLAEQHSLSLLPSASFADALSRHAGASGKDAVLFGDPDENDETWKLPAARDEVEHAYRTLQTGTPPFIGAQATKRELLDRAPAAQLLHVAAHHHFDSAAPLLSFLKLAGGPLYVLEIAQLRMQTQLVALSACETGLSRVETGDEQYGIVRAFLAVGVRSVVSTLWSIEDESAAILFSAFYQRAREMPLASALTEAQRLVREDPRYAHPFFWAPYVLTGERHQPLAL